MPFLISIIIIIAFFYLCFNKEAMRNHEINRGLSRGTPQERAAKYCKQPHQLFLDHKNASGEFYRCLRCNTLLCYKDGKFMWESHMNVVIRQAPPTNL